ncbi:MAG: Na/Pi symporter [Acidimicrobiia bacterium]
MMVRQADSPGRRLQNALRVIAVLALLFGFLVGIKALESGIKAFGSGFVDTIFDNVTNPVAGLFAGMLATVLVQSSSVTTSTIVGLVGAGVLGVPTAVPMIMGTNLGTTVTNTLVSLGHIRQGQEFRRAFAGATIHDFFNILTVIVALPLELATGFLSKSARALTDLLEGGRNLGGVTATSPLKVAVGWPIDRLQDLVAGSSGTVTGVVLLVAGIALIFTALTFITKTMRTLMAGGIERSLNRMLDRGAGMGALALGLVVTMLVQSSSITTSILIPMLAAGILTLENAYPVTLGANVGTTVTALLASLAVTNPDALTIALVHTLFNVFGILMFYPLPIMREVPLRLARATAGLVQRRASWALGYVLGLFVVVPVVGLVLLS